MNEKTSVRDLAQLPGPFAFKIIVKPDLVKHTHILALAESHLARDLSEHRLTSRASAQSNYRAYTLEVYILVFDEIETLYQAYRELEGVVMVL